MAANYPDSLPVKEAAGANLSSNPHSTLHDDMYDEIVAIATELATNAKGDDASVKARLDRVDTAVATRRGCNLRRVASQSATGSSAVTISWDTEDEDTDGFIAVTGTTATIPTGMGGIYAASVKAQGAGTWADGTVVYIQLDGSTFSLSGMPGASIGTVVATSYVGPMDAGTAVTALVRNNGSTQNMTAELALYRMGP